MALYKNLQHDLLSKFYSVRSVKKKKKLIMWFMTVDVNRIEKVQVSNERVD